MPVSGTISTLDPILQTRPYADRRALFKKLSPLADEWGEIYCPNPIHKKYRLMWYFNSGQEEYLFECIKCHKLYTAKELLAIQRSRGR